jgi:hypothetical protein
MDTAYLKKLEPADNAPDDTRQDAFTCFFLNRFQSSTLHFKLCFHITYASKKKQ